MIQEGTLSRYAMIELVKEGIEDDSAISQSVSGKQF
jgi:hypothetical protein